MCVQTLPKSLFNIFIWLSSKQSMGCAMADIFTDLLIYIGIGILTFLIGLILGYQLLIMHYTNRFMVIAAQCSDADSVVPMVDELARET